MTFEITMVNGEKFWYKENWPSGKYFGEEELLYNMSGQRYWEVVDWKRRRCLVMSKYIVSIRKLDDKEAADDGRQRGHQ